MGVRWVSPPDNIWKYRLCAYLCNLMTSGHQKWDGKSVLFLRHFVRICLPCRAICQSRGHCFTADSRFFSLFSRGPYTIMHEFVCSFIVWIFFHGEIAPLWDSTYRHFCNVTSLAVSANHQFCFLWTLVIVQGFIQPPRRGGVLPPPETNVLPLREDHQLPPSGGSTCFEGGQSLYWC